MFKQLFLTLSLVLTIVPVLVVLPVSCSNVQGTISPVCNAATGVCQAATAICQLIVQDTTSQRTIELAQRDLESRLYLLRTEAMQYYSTRHRDSISIPKKNR